MSTADWPKPVHNVEAIALGQVGEQLVFLYAERAQGKPNTRIAWAPFTLDPLRFGKFRSVEYTSPEPKGSSARPVTALTVDSAGTIYAGSASDPDVDDGPFSGFVWRIGELRAAGKRPAVVLNGQPELLATMDGFKVETVVVSETDDGPVVLVGTDDEFYGATLRPLLPTPD